jgi:CHAT domain
MRLMRPILILWYLLIGRYFFRGIRAVRIFSRQTSGPGIRAPFELPLHVTVVGRRWSKSIRRLLQDYKNGVEIRHAETPADLLSDQPPHILVADAASAGIVNSEYFRRAAESNALPTLVIVPGPPVSAFGISLRAPGTVALLICPRRDFLKFFRRMMDLIASDIPLDRAASQAARPTKGIGGQALLFTEPYLNHSLRMRDAAEMLEIEFELRGRFFETARPPELRPLAVARTELISGGYYTSWQPSADIVLLRAAFRESTARTLPPGTTLQAGGHYLVQVQIGNPVAASIVVREEKPAGSVDRTGPPKDARLLEVVIQPKDFKLRSRAMRFLYLEPSGASNRVRFAVTAPEQFGKASMRVVVFSGNQMLQAFDLRASVTDREVTSSARDAGATAELSFAQMTDVTGEMKLPDRVLTISVNRDGGTHAVLVKGSDATSGFDLSDSVVRKTLRSYRRFLKEATVLPVLNDNDKPQPRFPALLTDKPGDESRKYIRKLAELGRQLYQALYDADDTDRVRLLERIRDSDDEVISVVRHDFGFAWPWPIIYDFRLPLHIVGTTPQVCFGYNADGQECQHTAEKAVCCVRGFWGFRHQIEELDGKRVNSTRNSEIWTLNKPLAFVENAGTQYGVTMASALSSLPNSAQVPGADFLNKLWAQTTRPAMALVLGHMETEELENQPPGPRLVLEGSRKNPTHWLRDTDVMDRVEYDKPWDAPNPIVVLLSCDSANTSPETLSNLVLSFLKAHASAVVGTECMVFSGLLARFGTELAEAMIRDHRTLGEALRASRRGLLHQGIPLAFVVNAIGIADLKIK